MAKRDFSKMIINVETLSEKSIETRIKTTLKADLQGISTAQSVFLLCMYDKGSPFRLIQDFKDRRRQALEFSGLNNINRGTQLEEAVTLSKPNIRHFVTKLLRFQNHEAFAELVVLERLFYEYLEHLARPLSDEEDIKIDKELKTLDLKGKLTKQLIEVSDRIKQLKFEVFDQDEEAAKAVMNTITPEYVSEKMGQ